ncbi:serine hydrolase [Halobacillus kuroshimensis]|uniref:Serine hydrolase n=1 Tax=Halobacillus kuroshimensis TaxID=302481 RepID=A0ABS3DR43_9BACI|nr:serine hydrolase domain-containing protein [Halobacillus kuroshimensis]MBN8233781.1 serine hydrolase [Halobacillus kuroshimensis]
MRKKALSIILTTTLGVSLWSGVVEASPKASLEIPSKVNPYQQGKSSPNNHAWDRSYPTLPVLHPGSIRGAGMRTEPLKHMDNILQTAVDNDVMPGAVAFVARRGHIVKENSYGYAVRYEDADRTETPHPITMTKDTIFDLASISKIFTTTAAMKLYEQGEFKLDDPVAKHIPEFAGNGKEDVTIEQLMTHTSGFKPWIPLYQVEGDRNDRLQHVFQYPLEHAPGSTYTYSDLNMITLGALVERLSGMRLDTFVQQEITAPLGMDDTMYNPPEQLKNRIAATEYQPWTNRGLVWGDVHDESAWSLDGVAGHAGVFSTASDLAVFAHMFLKDGKYGGTRILEPETVELLTENRIPQFPGDDHGLGWELQQGWFMDALSSPSSYGHTGYTGTSIVVNPENETIAILLTNRVHPTRETVSTSPTRRAFARTVADAIPVTAPKSKKETWFAGYGDQLSRSMTAEVNLYKDRTLSFSTWHQIERGFDFGKIETSTDGSSWEEVLSLTGRSQAWEEKSLTIPAETKYVRFTYETDTSVNNRGWYIHGAEMNGTPLSFSSEEWEKRKY